jgi:hypothetical protein
MTTFSDPVSSIVQKLRANTVLTTLLPASHIHSSYPDAANSNPSVYIFAVRLQRQPVVSSGNQTQQVYYGSSRFQIEAYSEESLDAAITLGRIAAESAGPCIIAAGLWNFSYEMRGGDWDSSVGAFRATYRLDSSCSEWRSST